MMSSRRGPVGGAQVSCGQKLASSGYLVWQFGQTFIQLLASRRGDEQGRSPIVARRQTLVNTHFGGKINNCPDSGRPFPDGQDVLTSPCPARRGRRRASRPWGSSAWS